MSRRFLASARTLLIARKRYWLVPSILLLLLLGGLALLTRDRMVAPFVYTLY